MKHEVYGDLTNVKGHLVKSLEDLYNEEVPREQLTTPELDEKLLALTDALGREIAVYLSRQGRVLAVSVGDNATVDLPEVKSRKTLRLSGVRCLHTHPSGDTELSGPDLSSLRRLRFDVMAALGRADDGTACATIGFFSGTKRPDGTPELSVVGPLTEKQLLKVHIGALVASINKHLAAGERTNATGKERETAILAGLETGTRTAAAEDSLAELRRLVDTAGADVIGTCLQRKEKPDAAFFLGRGKVHDIAMAAQETDATMLVLDDEITPSQQRNLESALGLKVLDRTALILDIFAQRARTREGKLQVELAQLRYLLPRLGGLGFVLSRLGGGIGARGPGESKLELDRRRIRTRIHIVEQQIREVQKNRALHQRRRKNSTLPLVALVGYTNAGKSTLLNRLTGADAFAEDKLFATLDPLTRHLDLADGQEILLTDTVGFIQKLPHTLVPAFQATLEEVQEADLLLHVVDATSAQAEQQISAVIDVLREIGAETKPTLYVFNKVDQADQIEGESGAGESHAFAALLRDREGVLVSARTGQGTDALLEKIAAFFRRQRRTMELLLPFSAGALLSRLHALRAVRQEEYTGDGIRVTVAVDAELAKTCEPYECPS
ncbi:MAG: GTPase HflX [Selenomonadaceae bacterium]|nr:GTPase HflX [Selenomonadaceae bacterium]